MFDKILQLFHKKKHLCFLKDEIMELHRALRKAREDAGLSVNEVARHLGVGRSQIWRMEKDADFVSIARLRQVAELYGVQISTLFDDRVPNQAIGPTYQLIGMAVDAVNQVATNYAKSPSDGKFRQAVIAVIRHRHKEWDTDPTSKFDVKQYTALIEEHLR